MMSALSEVFGGFAGTALAVAGIRLWRKENAMAPIWFVLSGVSLFLYFVTHGLK